MKKQLLTLVGAVLMSVSTTAQTQYVHQVIILNEGQYDYFGQTQITPVSIASYDPSTDVYTEFDVINNVRFGSDVKVEADYIYVAADSLLLKYDANTLTLTDQATVKGIRKIAIWNNQLLVTIGENAVAHNSYFRVYDKNTLDFSYELTTTNGPIYSTEGIVVVNDTAYLAVNNSLLDFMNPKGLIGIVDLNGQTYEAEVDLAPTGVNPDNLMEYGGKIYVLNNHDFTASSLTEFNTADRSHVTTSLNAASGCGASAFAANNVYYHRYQYDTNWVDVNNTLNLYNVSSKAIDTIHPNLYNVYGMVDDVLNSQIYVTTTDFFSYGMAYKMDYSGNLVDSFSVGISPGNLAVDLRDLVGVKEDESVQIFEVHPNPSSSILYIDAVDASSYSIEVTDLSGRAVYSELVNEVVSQSVNIESWADGVYMLHLDSESGRSTHKIVKY